MTSTPETAPYGAWRSPITADLITGKRVGVVSPRIDGSDVYWIENRPAEAGRSVVVRRAAGRDDRRCHPIRIQRPHPRPRVRWRRIHGARRRAHLRQLRRHPALPSRRQRPAAADHAGGCVALRRRDLRSGSGAAHRRARGPLRRWGSGQYHRRARPRRRRERRYGPHLRRRLLLQSASQPRRPAAGLAAMEPSQHAMGRLGAVGRRYRARTE